MSGLTWLPNMVGGVSIWRLVGDLNAPQYFDGRLLEPETEGSDSLPTSVSWPDRGLLPLKEARTSHPEEVQTAIEDFLACLDKVEKELHDESSGFYGYRDAFTVPSLDAEDGSNYYFEPTTGKLRVINWGASPRELAGHGQRVFGLQSFDDMFAEAGVEREDVVAAAGKRIGLSGTEGEDAPPDEPEEAPEAEAAAPEPAPPEEAGEEEKKADEEKKKEEAKKPSKDARPWWFWALIGIGIIALVILILWLLRGCQDPGADGADAGAGGTAADAGAGANGAGANGAGADGAGANAGTGAANGAGAAGAGAAGSGGNGGAGGGGGAGGAGGAGAGGEGAGGEGAGGEGSGGGSGSGGAGSGSGSLPIEPGTGNIVVEIGPGGTGIGPSGDIIILKKPPSGSEIPYRSHFQPGAKAWRITKGANLVDPRFPPTIRDNAFDVYLKPGATFDEVEVQYKDAKGKWQTH